MPKTFHIIQISGKYLFSHQVSDVVIFKKNKLTHWKRDPLGERGTSMQQYQNTCYLFIEKGMGTGFNCIKNVLLVQREGEKCDVNMAKLCLYV